MKRTLLAPALALALSVALAAGSRPVAAEPGGIISKDGVRLLDQDRMVAFGESEAEVVAYVSGVFGAQPALSQERCRTGQLTHADWGRGLKLSFQDGRFVGWTADPRLEGAYGNRAGLVFGRAVADIRAQNPGFILSDAVQGREFVLDGVHGRVLQRAPEATIDLLWAGAGCYRR